MDSHRDDFLGLPCTDAERTWISERFDTLTAKESLQLNAAIRLYPPESAQDAINLLVDLGAYEVYSPAPSYEHLADFYLSEHEIVLPDEVMDFTDLEKIGRMFEQEHPGCFIGGHYIAFPEKTSPELYDGSNLGCIEDVCWSVKIKLASDHVPDGVWMRLPDYSEMAEENAGEIEIALRELGVNKVSECQIVDALCILPEAGNLMEQYDDVSELIYDGQQLGYILDEQYQGMKNFSQKFAAALAYEQCDCLKEVLDIADELHGYDFIPDTDLADYARQELKKHNVPDSLIESGVFFLEEMAEDLLRNKGYIYSNNDDGMIRKIGEYQQDQIQHAQIQQII